VVYKQTTSPRGFSSWCWRKAPDLQNPKKTSLIDFTSFKKLGKNVLPARKQLDFYILQ
jgi:hypothetical protein